MKKYLSYLLIFSICVLLIGCNSAPESTAPTAAKDPMWGKSYYVSFNAYTVHSGHPLEAFKYCLSDENYLISPQPAWDIKLEVWEFDPEAFTALCTDYGYWQDRFNPEYICENIDTAWKGSHSDGYDWYLLKLKDGMLMLASSRDYITSVEIIEKKGTQAEFFSYWHKKWQSAQFGDNPEAYQTWRELYNRHN